MPKRVFIIHGTGSSPKGNWFPWLRERLEEQGNEVYAPEFPIGDGQSLSNWLLTFDKYSNLVNSNTIMVGHSLGPAFILNLLEKSKNGISAAFLVAPFVEDLGLPEFDTLNRTFVNHKFDWTTIKERCRNFYVYASDNDPYVPFDKSKLVADKLDAKLTVIPGAKHMNSASGYSSFELLLKDMQKEL